MPETKPTDAKPVTYTVVFNGEPREVKNRVATGKSLRALFEVADEDDLLAFTDADTSAAEALLKVKKPIKATVPTVLVHDGAAYDLKRARLSLFARTPHPEERASREYLPTGHVKSWGTMTFTVWSPREKEPKTFKWHGTTVVEAAGQQAAHAWGYPLGGGPWSFVRKDDPDANVLDFHSHLADAGSLELELVFPVGGAV